MLLCDHYADSDYHTRLSKPNRETLWTFWEAAPATDTSLLTGKGACGGYKGVQAMRTRLDGLVQRREREIERGRERERER